MVNGNCIESRHESSDVDLLLNTDVIDNSINNIDNNNSNNISNSNRVGIKSNDHSNPNNYTIFGVHQSQWTSLGYIDNLPNTSSGSDLPSTEDNFHTMSCLSATEDLVSGATVTSSPSSSVTPIQRLPDYREGTSTLPCSPASGSYMEKVGSPLINSTTGSPLKRDPLLDEVFSLDHSSDVSPIHSRRHSTASLFLGQISTLKSPSSDSIPEIPTSNNLTSVSSITAPTTTTSSSPKYIQLSTSEIVAKNSCHPFSCHPNDSPKNQSSASVLADPCRRSSFVTDNDKESCRSLPLRSATVSGKDEVIPTTSYIESITPIHHNKMPPQLLKETQMTSTPSIGLNYPIQNNDYSTSGVSTLSAMGQYHDNQSTGSGINFPVQSPLLQSPLQKSVHQSTSGTFFENDPSVTQEGFNLVSAVPLPPERLAYHQQTNPGIPYSTFNPPQRNYRNFQPTTNEQRGTLSPQSFASPLRQQTYPPPWSNSTQQYHYNQAADSQSLFFSSCGSLPRSTHQFPSVPSMGAGFVPGGITADSSMPGLITEANRLILPVTKNIQMMDHRNLPHSNRSQNKNNGCQQPPPYSEKIPIDVRSSLVVSYIPTSWSLERLRKTFEPYGRVLQYRIDIESDLNTLHNRRGFIQLDSPEAAKYALLGLNGLQVEEGRRLKVEMKRYVPSRYRQAARAAYLRQKVMLSNHSKNYLTLEQQQQQQFNSNLIDSSSLMQFNDSTCSQSFDLISAAIDSIVSLTESNVNSMDLTTKTSDPVPGLKQHQGSVAGVATDHKESEPVLSSIEIFQHNSTSNDVLRQLPIQETSHEQTTNTDWSQPILTINSSVDQNVIVDKSNDDFITQHSLPTFHGKLQELKDSKLLLPISPHFLHDKNGGSHTAPVSPIGLSPSPSVSQFTYSNVEYFPHSSTSRSRESSNVGIVMDEYEIDLHRSSTYNPPQFHSNSMIPESDSSIIDENNLFVFHVPPDWTEQEFERQFSQFGSIRSLRFPKDDSTPWGHRGYGFVCYDHHEDARAAIIEMHGKEIEIGRRLKVEFKKTMNQRLRPTTTSSSTNPMIIPSSNKRMNLCINPINQHYSNNIHNPYQIDPTTNAAAMSIMMAQEQTRLDMIRDGERGLIQNSHYGPSNRPMYYNNQPRHFQSQSYDSTQLDSFGITVDQWPRLMSNGLDQLIEGSFDNSNNTFIPLNTMSGSTGFPQGFFGENDENSQRGQLFRKNRRLSTLIDNDGQRKPMVGLEDLDMFPDLGEALKPSMPSAGPRMSVHGSTRRKSQRERLENKFSNTSSLLG